VCKHGHAYRFVELQVCLEGGKSREEHMSIIRLTGTTPSTGLGIISQGATVPRTNTNSYLLVPTEIYLSHKNCVIHKMTMQVHYYA